MISIEIHGHAGNGYDIVHLLEGMADEISAYLDAMGEEEFELPVRFVYSEQPGQIEIEGRFE